MTKTKEALLESSLLHKKILKEELKFVASAGVDLSRKVVLVSIFAIGSYLLLKNFLSNDKSDESNSSNEFANSTISRIKRVILTAAQQALISALDDGRTKINDYLTSLDENEQAS